MPVWAGTLGNVCDMEDVVDVEDVKVRLWIGFEGVSVDTASSSISISGGGGLAVSLSGTSISTWRVSSPIGRNSSPDDMGDVVPILRNERFRFGVSTSLIAPSPPIVLRRL